MLDRLINAYCRLLSAINVVCLAAMVVMVFGNVVLRYGFNSGIAISEELSRWLFIWIVFLGATVAVRERAHMGTDMLVALLPVPLQRLCMVTGLGLMLFVTWLMFSGSVAQARIVWDVTAPVTGLPQAWFAAAPVVFSVSTGLLITLDLLRVITGRLSLEEVRQPIGCEPAGAAFSADASKS